MPQQQFGVPFAAMQPQQQGHQFGGFPMQQQQQFANSVHPQQLSGAFASNNPALFPLAQMQQQQQMLMMMLQMQQNAGMMPQQGFTNMQQQPMQQQPTQHRLPQLVPRHGDEDDFLIFQAVLKL